MKKLFCFAIFLAGLISLQGKIVEMHHFHEIIDHITPETLVILDIDDTLLVPVQMLGCDEWFKYRLEKRQTEGMSFAQALEQTITEWEAVRHITRMQTVEPESHAIVQALQSQGYHVMGLTTQEHTLSRQTIAHLAANQFNLALAAPHHEEHYFCLNGKGILYREGVLFTAGKHKGEALFLLCDKMGYKPKRILFVNDKATHLRDVEEIAEINSIEFVGLRYAYSDARKSAFRSDIAEVQFMHSSFERILSDEEALSLLQTNLLRE